VTDFALPKACNLGRKAIHEMGEDVAKSLGYTPGNDLEPIVKNLGGDITYQSLVDLEFSSSGSIEVLNDGEFHIFLAAHTSELRDRYTIGHELGHYVLHFLYPRANGDKIDQLRAARYGSGLVEYEANWFAAGFLMPADAFKTAWTEFHGDLARVADRFKVSLQASEVRAKSLSLLQ